MIELLDGDATRREAPGLTALLVDSVDSGASVGFLPPLDAGEARAYWHGVAGAVATGARLLWVAREAGGGVAGSVQLHLEERANGAHRAELMKLMVLTTSRRRGIGRALMLAAEAEAARRGRTTLVLDTRQGDPSELLYRSLGWEPAGSIPRYAKSADGSLHATAFYFRLLPAR